MINIAKSAGSNPNIVSYFTDATNNGRVLAWDSTKSDSYYQDLATNANDGAGATYYVYNYNKCNAFYGGVHVEAVDDQNPCWLTECSQCGLENAYVGNDSTHKLTTEMIYENYLANGVKKTYCTNAKCTQPVIEEALAPLFNFKGYSSNDSGEMCVAYIIDTIHATTLSIPNTAWATLWTMNLQQCTAVPNSRHSDATNAMPFRWSANAAATISSAMASAPSTVLHMQRTENHI